MDRLHIAPGSRRGFVVMMMTVAALMVIGGGVADLSQTVVAAFLAALLVISGDGTAGMQRIPILPRVALMLVVALPLVQLMPLPPAIWHALPGQGLRLRVLDLLDAGRTWQPLSLTPLYTAQVAIMAVTFVMMVGALTHAPAAIVRSAGWLILTIVALGLMIGLVQVSTNGTVFRLHRIAHHGALIGFMANKNHMGLLIACSLPLAAMMVDTLRNRAVGRVLLSIYLVVMLAALVTTNSRAGLLLGLAAAAFVAWRTVRRRHPAIGMALALAAAAGVLLIIATPTFDTLFDRFGAIDEDLRWQFLETSMPLIDEYWRLGSGGGSFATIYQVNEQLTWVRPTYVNQLHNDYPQLVIEFGVPGVIAALLLSIGTGAVAVRRWRGAEGAVRRQIEYAGLILILFAVHSFVDYPLRRPAMLPIFAFALAITLRPDAICGRTSRAA